MHHSYCDIRNRIGEEPTWWDENAVPRYQPFRPQECANIHAAEAALVLITCQDCGKEYRVAFTLSQRPITHRAETAASRGVARRGLRSSTKSPMPSQSPAPSSDADCRTRSKRPGRKH